MRKKLMGKKTMAKKMMAGAMALAMATVTATTGLAPMGNVTAYASTATNNIPIIKAK